MEVGVGKGFCSDFGVMIFLICLGFSCCQIVNHEFPKSYGKEQVKQQEKQQ